MALAWTLGVGHNAPGGALINNRQHAGESFLAILTGGTGYLSFTTKPAIIEAVEYIGGTNNGATTEAMAGAASLSYDNGQQAAGTSIDQILSATTTMAAGTRTPKNLFGTYCQTGFGATLANATDTVRVWFRYA